MERAYRGLEKAAQQTSKRHDSEVASLRSEVVSLRHELRERLLQYHLQLGRLSTVVDGRREGPLGGRVPLPEVSDEESVVVPPAPASAGGLADAAGTGWLVLTACPACRAAERTVVCEWNKLALLDTAPDAEASRYDFAVCHGCGVLYATRRPIGDRYPVVSG